jgi:hypothetical protein
MLGGEKLMNDMIKTIDKNLEVPYIIYGYIPTMKSIKKWTERIHTP